MGLLVGVCLDQIGLVTLPVSSVREENNWSSIVPHRLHLCKGLRELPDVMDLNLNVVLSELAVCCYAGLASGLGEKNRQGQ